MTSREVFGNQWGKASEGREPHECLGLKHIRTVGEGARRREVGKTCGRRGSEGGTSGTIRRRGSSLPRRWVTALPSYMH